LPSADGVAVPALGVVEGGMGELGKNSGFHQVEEKTPPGEVAAKAWFRPDPAIRMRSGAAPPIVGERTRTLQL
jgi:hypothetical protein